MEHIFLSLQDVETAIRKFEQAYGATSVDFLRGLVQGVSEDDSFEWEAYLDHRANLRMIHQKLHRAYVGTVRGAGADKCQISERELLELVA